MAKQEMVIRVSQQHSCGGLRVTRTWTSDGVVVASHATSVRVKGDRTLDRALYEGVVTAALRQAKYWTAQGPLW